MMKGLQSIEGLTRARTEGLPGLATEPADTRSIGAVVSHRGTAFHCPQLWEISSRTHPAATGPTPLSCSARRSLVQIWHGKGLS
jgi:hypothetical protein